MEFKHIEYFTATYNLGSMSRAAQHLFISQQALSRIISNLEKELNCKLFERTPRGIVPTAQGDYLYSVFGPVVRDFKTATRSALQHFGMSPLALRFCCAPLMFQCLNSEPLVSFHAENPTIIIQPVDMSETACKEYISADPRHFGLMPIPNGLHKNEFDYMPVDTFVDNIRAPYTSNQANWKVAFVFQDFFSLDDAAKHFIKHIIEKSARKK